jgi:hypothetical protein
MTTERVIGTPVWVEHSDPKLAAAVAQAKQRWLDEEATEVVVVSRLEGLRINERSAIAALNEASKAMTAARLNYHAAVDLYRAAVEARIEEENNGVSQTAEGHGNG